MSSSSSSSSLIAFIQSGGHQLKAEVGQSVLIDYSQVQAGESMTFDRVLLILDGKKTQVGKPYIRGAKVVGEVEAHRKDKKVIVFKKKRRKGYAVKNGHRQTYTQVAIKEIIRQ